MIHRALGITTGNKKCKESSLKNELFSGKSTTLNNRIITVNTYVIVNKNTFLKNEIIIATLNGIAVNNTL